ncbi:hypothetical protein, partial [Bowmanella yangjiangensis]
IESHADLQTRLQAVLDRDGPVICEVLVQVEEPRVPRVMTRIDENGKPVSGALEDLYPFLGREELAQQMAVSLEPPA